ncbi:hypothetical protein BV20DRAFT_677500 [Pilatotrama ljubarskyi]|nr:hypothetical protein BV20DRAFT_677500 [Pilatotrama ljubarskyi]
MNPWDSVYEAHTLNRNKSRRDGRPPKADDHDPRRGRSLAGLDDERVRRGSVEDTNKNSASSNALVPPTQANRRYTLLPTPLVHPTNNVTVVVNVFDKEGAKQVLNTLPNIVSSSHPGAASHRLSGVPTIPRTVMSYPIPRYSDRPAYYPRAPSPPWKHNGKRKYECTVPSGSDDAKRRREERIVEVAEDEDEEIPPVQRWHTQANPSGWSPPSREDVSAGEGAWVSPSSARKREPRKHATSEVARRDGEEVEYLYRQAAVHPESADQRVQDWVTTDSSFRARPAPTPVRGSNGMQGYEIPSPPSSERRVASRSARSHRYSGAEALQAESGQRHEAPDVPRSRPVSRTHNCSGDAQDHSEIRRTPERLAADRFRGQESSQQLRHEEHAVALPTPRTSASIRGQACSRSPNFWCLPVRKEGTGNSANRNRPKARLPSVPESQTTPTNEHRAGRNRLASRLPHGRVFCSFCKYCYPNLKHLPDDIGEHLRSGCSEFNQSTGYRSGLEKGWPHADICDWALNRDKTIIVEVFCRNDAGYLAKAIEQKLTPNNIEMKLTSRGAHLCKNKDCACCPDLPLIDDYLKTFVIGEASRSFGLHPVSN